MDDYILQEELEAMARNAFNTPTKISPSNDSPTIPAETEPIIATASRWRNLFNLPQDEAIESIISHRNNLTRTRISDEHWEILRSEKEAEGYDREAYEYGLELQKKKAALPNLLPSAEDASVIYLVELTGLLDSAEKVQEVAGMKYPAIVVNGSSVEDERSVSLCCVDAKAKAAILQWASDEGGGFEPTILVDPRSLR